jgi:hypothetical protein
MKLQLDVQAVNKDMLVETGGGAKYPYIQPTTYEPSKPSDKIGFALSPDVLELELLTKESIEALKLMPYSAVYNTNEVEMLEITASVRWVILAKPRTYGMDKTDKKIYPLESGVKLRDMGRVTCAKVFLGAVVDDVLLTAEDKSPQIFTFKLKSTATNLIAVRDKPEMSTIETLNKSLQKFFKAPTSWCTHLVSVDLQAFAEKKTSTIDTSQSKMATSYRFSGAAKSVPVEYHQKIRDLVGSDDFKAMAADPFRLNGITSGNSGAFEAAPPEDYYSEEAEY